MSAACAAQAAEIERLRAELAELETENSSLADTVHDLSPAVEMTDEEIAQAAKAAGGDDD